MDNVDTVRPVGMIDGSAKAGTARLAHGDVVLEALSTKVRFMIAGVLLANLTLGAWLAGRSDFSSLKPPVQAASAPSHEAPYVLGQRLTLTTSNDRD